MDDLNCRVLTALPDLNRRGGPSDYTPLIRATALKECGPNTMPSVTNRKEYPTHCTPGTIRPITSKAPKKAAPFLPYRKVLPEGFVCPGPEYLREDMLQAEPIAESAQGGRLMYFDHKTGEYLKSIAEERSAGYGERAARPAAEAEVARLQEELRRLRRTEPDH